MGGNKVYRGIYFGDREWREETRFTWFPADVFESRMWQSQDPNSPSFKLVQRITERVNAPPPKADVPSVAAVYIANQYTGGSTPSGTQVIVKIHMRIPYLEVREGNTYVSTKDLFSQPLPREDCDPTEPLEFYPREVDCLRHLTDHKCPYTPSLITSFEICKDDNPWVKDGFMGFIVMEKLPAITVSDIWADGPDSEEQIQEQLRIQEAFKVAVLAVHNLGVKMHDRAPRNLMWDKEAGKCYLIDFEDASIKRGLMLSAKWEDLERNSERLFCTFTSWDLIMDHQYRQQQELLHPRPEIY